MNRLITVDLSKAIEQTPGISVIEVSMAWIPPLLINSREILVWTCPSLNRIHHNVVNMNRGHPPPFR